MIINKELDLYIVYIYSNIDVFNIEDISSLLRDIFLVLNKKYDLCGLCNVDIYVNDDFGMIIEINNIDRYTNYYDVSLKIHLNSVFLNEVNYNNYLYDDIYYYKDKYYTKYRKDIDSNVIYKNVLDIINNGIKVK